MKKPNFPRKAAAIVPLLCLLLSAGALAGSLGDELHSAGTELAEGTRLAGGVYWNTAYSDRLSENYIEYTPSAAVTPVVVYGSKVLNYGSFNSMAALLESRGQHVIGGINGDYYVMANYQPLGIVVTDGILRSSDGGFNAIGFNADGTAIIGAPALSLSVDIGGEPFPLDSVNKIRSGGGICLYTEDFAATTKTNQPGINVVLSVADGGPLRIGSALTLKVLSVHESAGDFAIPAGSMVLSLNLKADNWRLEGIRSIQPGDELILRCDSGDARWREVRHAVGSFQKLVTGGAAESGLDYTKNPRSAVGVKADGTVILYTIDGRQPGHSAGIGTAQLAARLIELGCVEAGLMDGGGSTSMNALYIGKESISQINSPSDGYQRSVTDYIMLVTTAGATGVPARLGLYPYDSLLLSGARQSFEVKAADSAGYPAALPARLQYSLSSGLGSVSPDGVFTAGVKAGQETVIVSGGGAEGFATVTVVKTPHEIDVYNEGGGGKLTSLKAGWGEKTQLSARAAYNSLALVSDDGCYKWSVTGGVGTIDAHGTFTAAAVDASGEILVTAGDKTVSIPVTVYWSNPFSDVKETDWFYESVSYVCRQNLFSGVSQMSFAPGAEMTRGMLVTVLGRHAGIDAGDYDREAFYDTNPDAWYGPYAAWAAENGIANGYGDGSFRPNGGLTREQLCALLVRYAGYLGAELPQNRPFSDIADGERISSYARAAVESCYRAGIIEGKGGGVLDPTGSASRSEVAAMLRRFINALA